ncbi:MAG TPA: gamma-glutamyl-gamma-aminobutyrate hydrolase family protein, partial [Limnochordia bacterium]|nr:gamma-glutamyl-gamma-aminobutyrate hydrolase family protein [Limnochordia bacterium]
MSAFKPWIGLVTYGRDAGNRFSLPAEYVDAVRRAGGLPVLLPPGEPDLGALLSRLDGLILTGGGDIDPARYGGERHPTIYSLDAERDEQECALVRRVVAEGLPTLGICRGSQVINVALGGSLIEHLPDVVGEATLHRVPPRNPVPHPVTIAPGTRLHELVGPGAEPASWHHQAVRALAPGLVAAAHAPDGTIEAVERPGHPWLLAVQWHPELTAAKDPIQQRLFDAFVQ